MCLGKLHITSASVAQSTLNIGLSMESLRTGLGYEHAATVGLKPGPTGIHVFDCTSECTNTVSTMTLYDNRRSITDPENSVHADDPTAEAVLQY
jgi:hypothetical protein